MEYIWIPAVQTVSFILLSPLMSHSASSSPDVQHPQLWRSLCSVIRGEVKAAHVYAMTGMYLYVTQRQMSRCFITLSVHYQDYNNTWIWK